MHWYLSYHLVLMRVTQFEFLKILLTQIWCVPFFPDFGGFLVTGKVPAHGIFLDCGILHLHMPFFLCASAP